MVWVWCAWCGCGVHGVGVCVCVLACDNAGVLSYKGTFHHHWMTSALNWLFELVIQFCFDNWQSFSCSPCSRSHLLCDFSCYQTTFLAYVCLETGGQNGVV